MPEFDYEQRNTTPEYRDGWELIWGKKDRDQVKGSSTHEKAVDQSPSSDSVTVDTTPDTV